MLLNTLHILPHLLNLATADCNKVTQDGESGSEDAQFRVSDVPYPNMGRGDIKFI